MLNGIAKLKQQQQRFDNKAVTFSIDNVNARINNKPAKMDVPARLINGKNNGTFAFPFGKYGIQCRLGR